MNVIAEYGRVQEDGEIRVRREVWSVPNLKALRGTEKQGEKILRAIWWDPPGEMHEARANKDPRPLARKRG